MSLRGRVAAIALLMVLAVAALAPFLPHDPRAVRGAAGVAVLRAPSASHWLGTDDRGRDVAARLAHGARTTLLVGAAAAVIALLAGTLAGATAAVRGGAWDATVLTGCDLVAALPPLVLVLAAQGLLGRATLSTLVLLIALPRAADLARLARAEVASALAAPHAEAARAVGAGVTRLVLRHALPMAAPQLAVAAAGTFATAALAEAALTFLGLGVPHPLPSWGELLRQAHQNGLAWWLAVPAGAAVTLVTLAANTLADELADERGRRERTTRADDERGRRERTTRADERA